LITGQSIFLPVVWTTITTTLQNCKKVPSEGHPSHPHASPKKGPWLHSEAVQISVALRTVMAGTMSL